MKKTTQLFTSKVLSFAFAFTMIASSTASAAVISWTGSADVDDEAITFAGFSSFSLVAINPSSGYFHDHSGPTTFTLQIELNGVFTDLAVYSTLGDDLDHPLDQISSTYPIVFAEGIVTAIRLIGLPQVNQGFHSLSSDTTFTFSDGTTTPEPGSLILMATGMFGLAFMRRRQKTN